MAAIAWTLGLGDARQTESPADGRHCCADSIPETSPSDARYSEAAMRRITSAMRFMS